LHLQNGIALCRQSRLYEYEYEARTALVELYVRCSELDGAGVQLDEIRTLVETMNSADKYAKIERLTAERSLATGRQQEALVQASSAVQIASGCGDSKEAAICRRVLGNVHLAIGDPARAEAELVESEATLRDLDSYEAARSRFHLGRALLALGNAADGEALVDETRRFFEQVDAGFDIAEIMALVEHGATG
jgi:ATP/maltotriose-dependent transcriptional regulator MalT